MLEQAGMLSLCYFDLIPLFSVTLFLISHVLWVKRQQLIQKVTSVLFSTKNSWMVVGLERFLVFKKR